MNWSSIKNYKWIKRAIALFNQGLTPKDMALSIVLGSLIGVIPLVGVATPMITLVVVYMRLNLPIAIFMTYVVSPVHLLLFIPFIRIGEWLYGVEHTLLTLTAIKEAFLSNYMNAFQDLIFQIFCGLTGWVVVGIPVAILLFYLLYLGLQIFRKGNAQG